MKLTEHFTLEEMTYSDTAIKYRASNLPTEQHLNTLKHTCKYLLEVLRDLFNKKFVGNIYRNKKVAKVIIKITSGYRSKTVNALLLEEGYHPSLTSQHCTGEAADIEIQLIYEDGSRAKYPYTETYKQIRNWVNKGEVSVDQCIQEKEGNSVWVHVSHSAWGKTKDRKDFLELNY